MKSPTAAPWVFLLGLIAGCAGPSSRPAAAPAPSAVVYRPKNFVGVTVLPRSVRRVVILPVHGGAVAAAEDCATFDPIFITALERQVRFEVVSIDREEFTRSFGRSDLASTELLPADFLGEIGRKYDAQAVMMVDVTTYNPYRPMALGIRAKLATVADRRLIWSFDEVFNCLDPAVANGVRRFYFSTLQKDVPVDLTTDALESPSRFAAYAAATAFSTLPRR